MPSSGIILLPSALQGGDLVTVSRSDYGLTHPEAELAVVIGTPHRPMLLVTSKQDSVVQPVESRRATLAHAKIEYLPGPEPFRSARVAGISLT